MKTKAKSVLFQVVMMTTVREQLQVEKKSVRNNRLLLICGICHFVKPWEQMGASQMKIKTKGRWVNGLWVDNYYTTEKRNYNVRVFNSRRNSPT